MFLGVAHSLGYFTNSYINFAPQKLWQIKEWVSLSLLQHSEKWSILYGGFGYPFDTSVELIDKATLMR